MRLDVSLLPDLAATYLLVFARLGTMLMLMPGLGERTVPVRFRLTMALMLALVMFPLHRQDYTLDARAPAALFVLLVQEILIGLVFGLTARLTLSALQVAGTIIAQQVGLGFVTQLDPTQGQQGVLVGNFISLLGIALIFALDLHHLLIAALSESYTLFRPGTVPVAGDMSQLVLMIVASSFRVGLQLSAPFIVFGLVFNLGLGVLARLMPQMQVFFVGVPISIVGGFLLLAALIGVIMSVFVDHFSQALRLLLGQG